MKLFLRRAAPAALAACACALLVLAAPAAARADDAAKDALKKAQAAQNDAPACRMTMTSTDLDSKRVTLMTTEFVKPDAMHTRVEVDGKVLMEMITDGKRTFMRQGGDTQLAEAPAHVSSMLMAARKNLSLDMLIDDANEVKLAGHETVDGKPASIYEFATENMGLTSNTKVWVSDADSRPLKAEADSKGEMKFGAAAGRKTNTHALTTFDYDPSIKITLPSS